MSTEEDRTVVVAPPIAFQDYPVDIQIRIYRDKARYGADIFAVGQMQRVAIEMLPHDLAALNKQLQGEMHDLVAVIVERNERTLVEKMPLCCLVEVGSFAFKRVFGHHDTRAALRDAMTAVQEQLSWGRAISIQIASEDFFLPWELIYPASLDEPLSYDRFWGMNYIVSRVIVQEARPGAFVSPVIPVTTRPRFGLLTYGGLHSVRDKEIPFFEKLDGDGKIALYKLRALNPEKKREEIKAFKSFWSNALDVAHFACHAFYEDESPDLSRILLSEEFPISLRDMEVYGIEINGYPLIVMNACETGNLNPLYTSYFAAAFLKYGARGVVATECAVPDDFAADFAEQLYTHLLAGEPLGESLLATRRYFLEKHNNPTGLLYSMYAPPSIRLVRTGE